MPRLKRPKPTFDIARDELDQSRAGWVYRSDTTPAEPAPVAPHASSSKAPSWIEAGVGVMVFPLTLAVVMMAAPVIWMLRARERTH